MLSHYVKSISALLSGLLLSAAVVSASAFAQEGKRTDAVRNAPRVAEAPWQSGPGMAGAEAPSPYTIGCILPLTGRNAAYGNAALEAILLALGMFDPLKESPFRLMIEDSRSETEAARLAAQKLAANNVVICILGPLGSAEATEAAREAQNAGVPILTFTQNEKIIDTGNYVFRYFSSGRIQVRTLVKYAVQNMGLARFAVLYPQDDYGQEMMNLFREEVLKRGGQIKILKSYDKTKSDFEKEILALKTPDAVQGEKDRRSQDIPASAPDFDALFIPDSYLRVNMIVPQLAFHDVTGIHLLGTGAWSSPALLKENGAYLEGAIFTDDFYRDSYYPEVNDFIDAFFAAYGREPEGLEALVYDAAGIAANLIAGKRRETREQFRNALSGLRDFPGVTGRMSTSVGRDVEKDSFLLTIRNGQIVQIK